MYIGDVLEKGHDIPGESAYKSTNSVSLRTKRNLVSVFFCLLDVSDKPFQHHYLHKTRM